MIKVSVQNNIELKSGVYELSFKRNFYFKAGQIIGVTQSDKIKPRLYSIASGENDPQIKILYDVNPQGQLTPYLSKLKEGEEILITKPKGSFIYTEEPAWFIASGTGISPFVSMAKSYELKNKTVIHGGRYLNSFYYSEIFKPLNNKYIRCCSIESSNEVYSGRLTKYLKEIFLPSTTKYYLCGSSEMVVDTREILTTNGVPLENIISEIYF